MVRSRWHLGALLAAVLGSVLAVTTSLLTPVRAAAPPVERQAQVQRYNASSRETWTTRATGGIPVALARRDWGAQPYAVGFARFGTEKWTYARFPIPCNPADSDLPSYQVVWVTNADRPPKRDLMASKPRLVRQALRRTASIFAASASPQIRSVADLERAPIPRFVTAGHRSRGVCTPRIDRVAVPDAVLAREAIQDWVNPATGERELGIFGYLEEHGYPARDNRRTIAIVTDRRSPDYAYWGIVGEAVALGIGSAYGPADTRPDQQNANNAGGLPLAVFAGSAADFRPDGDLAATLAHEITHGLGAVMEDAAHQNPENFGHASDCADLMCYNDIDWEGQDYQACSRARRNTFGAFTAVDGDLGRAAYRLDCHRDDYWALRQNGSGEKPWADERWSVSRNRFLWGNQDREPYTGRVFSAPTIAPSCVDDPVDGYCPPGVVRPSAGAGRRTAERPVWAID